METRDLSTITYASYNPRILSEHDGKSLDNSMTTFGDIAGITFNKQTGNLVCGHQRLKILDKKFPGRVKIQVEQIFEAPDDYGTIGTGHVVVEGTKLAFAYREVMWSEATEKTANIAANRIEADWDKDLLAQINYELSQLENGAELLSLTGQTPDEITKLINMVAGEPDIELPDGDKPGYQTMSFTLSDDQAAIVNEAMTFIKKNKSFEGTGNENSNGNALYFVAREFLDYTNGLIDERG